MAVRKLVSDNPVRMNAGFGLPKPQGTAVDVSGVIAPTATGTATSATLATTSRHTRARRIDYLVTSASTTAVAGLRFALAHLMRGGATSRGGFLVEMTGAPATGQSTSTSRFFMGLTAIITAPSDAEPSAQVSCIGVGWDAADTNIQIMHNDASGTCTKVDTGWAVPTTDRAKWFRLKLYCSPGEDRIHWDLEDLAAGNRFQGDTAGGTDIPAADTYLSERIWASVGGTSSVIGVAFGGLYFETGD